MFSLLGVNHFNEVGTHPLRLLLSPVLYHFLSCLSKDLVSHITLLFSEIFGLPLLTSFPLRSNIQVLPQIGEEGSY